jgi:valyl-tRNA synthetase
MQIDKVYDPRRFEPQWAEKWTKSGIFGPSGDSFAPVFSLVIPPPNVTGSLHMGHMLEHTEIDVTIRWHRMSGHRTLWLPGTDHAGIATQMVVERKLAEEGLDRRQLGREEFVKRVWEWKEHYGGTIKRQMMRLGASCDWTRERFTMDAGLSRAVREVFVRLYEKGLIYRGEYMVNWCPRCHTALSDLEVVRDESQGSLWHIRYPIKDSPKYLVVATTRPETMLGDTAVAINPADERYTAYHGKQVRLPLTGREIPVILDELAQVEFGTGVVKVTPAHDHNDFEAGRRHNLPLVKVIDERGVMTAEAGAYAGLDRFEARKRVVEDLQKLGLLEKIEPYPLAVGKCQRCKTIVEPLVSTQWFVKTQPLAAPAIRAVEEGRTRIVPENFTKVYNEWMYNIRDWCISRQLWWGHRIPAWHCPECGGITVGREDPKLCSKCGSARIEQDTDVLDTWFSSALWPFSTLGWPDKTSDLETYYPTSLLITGFDILFFWVARMMMMGLEFMGDVPFREVYIHALVRDAERQKMSKTKGNVIDPLEVTEKYGTDAVRMALLMGAAPGTDIALSDDRMTSARAFANKIWNAARFLFLNMERSGVEPQIPSCAQPETLEDRWIFSRLNRCVETVNRAIETYRYHEAAQSIWQFFWHEFCDWYLEVKKLRFREGSGLTNDWRSVLFVFENAIRLLHPLMPFLSEELWQRLAAGGGGACGSIALTRFPQTDPTIIDEATEREMETLQAIITAARNLRAEMGADPKLELEGALHAQPAALVLARTNLDVIQKLASLKLELHAGTAPPRAGVLHSTPDFDLVLRLPVAQAAAQRRRLEKQVEQLEKVIASSKRQLSDQAFLGRAPDHVVQSIRQKLGDYEAQAAKSRAALEAIPAS